MRRHPDWTARLVAYLAEVGGRPCAYGRHDCALFTAGAVDAMTGSDFLARYADRYTTRHGGLRALMEDGHDGLFGFLSENFEEMPPALAHPGDIVCLETADGPGLGVLQGEMIYAVGETGLRLVSRLLATRAWRVP